MSPMHPQLGTFLALGLVFALGLVNTVAGIVRDADWWVIVRGVVTGRAARIRRAWRTAVRRG